MRYIRTKNGTILDLDTMEFDWALPRENFVKANAVKESDNLEDLIDEYVLARPGTFSYSILAHAHDSDKDRKLPLSKCFTKNLKNNWLSYCEDYIKDGYNIYGAVWVITKTFPDGGFVSRLEPVTKPMTLDGRLELL